MTSARLQDIAASQTEPTLPLHLQRIVLTGFMGAGKSTIGRLLAQRIGWAFLDLDAHLEARAGASVPQLFERYGEAHFRHLESQALASALGHTRTVLALGGGTPEVLTNRLLLEQTPGACTVFLSAPFETLFDRCLLQQIDRPVLADLDRARERFLLRQPGYRRLARITIDTETHSPNETASMLLLALEKRTSAPR